MSPKKADLCIFCMESPCVCNKKATKPVVPKVPKVTKPPVEVPASSAPPKVQVVPEASDEEILFNAAIRALAPLLSRDDTQKYAAILGSNPSPSERARAWRLRQATDNQ